MDFPIGSMGAAILGALAVLAWRMHESRRPVSLRGLVIPPLGMSTGFSMFAMQAFRVPWMWGLSAFVLGAAIFAQPVIATWANSSPRSKRPASSSSWRSA